jgi:hypothetical protein
MQLFPYTTLFRSSSICFTRIAPEVVLAKITVMGMTAATTAAQRARPAGLMAAEQVAGSFRHGGVNDSPALGTSPAKSSLSRVLSDVFP